MILYDYWRSTSAWRVRLVMHVKGVPFERRVINLAPGTDEQHSAAFRALNPLSQVPVLIVDHAGKARVITQSLAIIGYLEERFPSPPLLPADPWLRARARQLAEMVNSGIQPLQNLQTLNQLRATGGDPSAWARFFIGRGLTALETAAQETVGRHLVGDTPTLADIYLVPQLYNARRFGVDLTPFPTLVRVETSCAALPVFIAAHPDLQSDAQKG